MLHVAKRESLEPELIRSEVARGRMIIPANIAPHRTSSPWPSALRRSARSTPTSATRPPRRISKGKSRSCATR
ncbi:MAG: hypothetical protein U5J83_01635 [Bryobacterales bacterium]|nr:hypothetical protein [Bryobacterales bacterium]